MFSRNLDKAREAFEKKDIEKMRVAHEHSAAEHQHKKGGEYLKSGVYGGLDGIITTFAVVAGVAGASLSATTVLILGFANLIADGISMAVGDYLSTKAEKEYQKKERERETWENDNFPEGEKKEMVEFYTNKGFTVEDSKKLVTIISKNKEAMVDIMMVEELGILETNESPLRNAIVTFTSFIIFGFVPLIIYVVAWLVPTVEYNSFFVASILTGITLFILGAVKVRLTGKNWVISGFEMLVVGGIAATAAYGVGYLLAGIV